MNKKVQFLFLSFRYVAIRFLFFLCFLVFAVFYVKPFRNFVLKPVWPRVWRKINTADVLTILQTPYLNVSDLDQCETKVRPGITIEDVRLAHPFSEMTSKVALREESHRSFLPDVADVERRDILLLYTVLAQELDKAGVPHFLVEGTLLGVARHDGFIPWDDDLDITVSVRHWERVRQALSCIEGFYLQTTLKMHWKFSHDYSRYPYIDVFFYAQNDEYLWAVTHYIATAIAFRLDDVFPLTKAKFENLLVPVPRKTLEVADDIFDITACHSPSVSHKTAEDKQVIEIPCSDLDYLYSMKNHR